MCVCVCVFLCLAVGGRVRSFVCGWVGLVVSRRMRACVRACESGRAAVCILIVPATLWGGSRWRGTVSYTDRTRPTMYAVESAVVAASVNK